MPTAFIEQPLGRRRVMSDDETGAQLLGLTDDDLLARINALCVTLITGMSDTVNVDQVYSAVPKFVGRPFDRVLPLAHAVKLPGEDMSLNSITGIIFVPKQLSADGRNKIFLFDSDIIGAQWEDVSVDQVVE